MAKAHEVVVDDLVWVVHDTNPHALSSKIKSFLQASPRSNWNDRTRQRHITAGELPSLGGRPSLRVDSFFRRAWNDAFVDLALYFSSAGIFTLSRNVNVEHFD